MVQDFASYCRLVKCSHESTGQEEGNRRRKDRQRASEVGILRSGSTFRPSQSFGQKNGGWLVKVHGKGKALSILAHKLGRAIYYMLKNNVPFNLEKFLATA